MPLSRYLRIPAERAELFVERGARSFAHRELRLFLRRLALLVLLIQSLIVIGTLGFALLEDRTLWGGLLRTLDIVATIGSREQPRTVGAQMLWLVLVTVGVGTMFYALVAITEFFVAGHLSGLLGTRRMARKIESVRDHYLICGFGRVGRQVARDLQRAGVPFVVIDDNPDVRRFLDEEDVPFVVGRASDDEVLEQAGIERARGVVACVDSDAENIFTTLSARGLSERVEIVSRASDEESFGKLRRAGANRVISPYMISGQAMAKLVVHPHVGDYLDVVAESASELRMEEIELIGPCRGLGCTVEELGRRQPKVMVVAVRKGAGEFQLKPEPDAALEQGDALIAIGTVTEMEAIERLFAPEGDAVGLRPGRDAQPGPGAREGRPEPGDGRP